MLDGTRVLLDIKPPRAIEDGNSLSYKQSEFEPPILAPYTTRPF
jgi:hypothetical protein